MLYAYMLYVSKCDCLLDGKGVLMAAGDIQLSEFLFALLGVSAAILLGGSLILVLLNIRFAAFRRFTLWKLKRMLDPDGIESDFWRGFVEDIRYWLEQFPQERSRRSGRKSPHGRSQSHSHTRSRSSQSMRTGARRSKGGKPRPSYLLGAEIGSSLSYKTFLSADRQLIIREPQTQDGVRVLSKEATVINFLRQRAQAGIYANYLPEPTRAVRDAGYAFEPFVYRHVGSHWRSGSQVLNSDVPITQEQAGWIFSRLLQVLGFAHEQNTIHAAVMPQHIMLDMATHKLMLVDWTHAKRAGEDVRFIPDRYDAWYPKTWTSQQATRGLDIAMAARTVLSMASGLGPPNGADDFDVSGWTPRFQAFWRKCLNAARCGAAGRQAFDTDAWVLHEELLDLLESSVSERRSKRPRFAHA